MKAKKVEHLSDTQLIMLVLHISLRGYYNFYDSSINDSDIIKELKKRGEELRMHINLKERIEYYGE